MNKFKENKIFEKNESSPDVKTPEYIGFSKKPDIVSVKEKILKNQVITREDTLNMIEDIKKLKVSIFGQEMTKKELGEISKETIDISKKILEENKMGNAYKLTYLFPDVLEALIKSDRPIFFDVLTFFTDDQIKKLSEHKNDLWLDGPTSFTDNQIEILSRQEGLLSLQGLTSLTDHQAKILFKHNGDL